MCTYQGKLGEQSNIAAICPFHCSGTRTRPKLFITNSGNKMKLWTWEIVIEQQEESVTKAFWRVTHAPDLPSAWAGFDLEVVHLFPESADILPVSLGGYFQTPSLQIQSGFNKRGDFL